MVSDARAPEGSERAQARIVEEGWLGNRPFVRFADGVVEVETVLGARRFRNAEEARGFVGA